MCVRPHVRLSVLDRVEALSGKVEVRSVPGDPSILRLALPVRPADDHPEIFQMLGLSEELDLNRRVAAVIAFLEAAGPTPSGTVR